jgi:hypothetical protein
MSQETSLRNLLTQCASTSNAVFAIFQQRVYAVLTGILGGGRPEELANRHGVYAYVLTMYIMSLLRCVVVY